MNNNTAIAASGLRKAFGGKTVLDGTLAWCAAIGIAGYAWAVTTFKKRV